MTRTTDPFTLFREHQELIYQVLGGAGVAILLFVLIRIPVMRLGGWTAAWQRACYEAELTAYAFTAPFRTLRAHQRVLRRLTVRLRQPAVWQDAERAVGSAWQAAGVSADRRCPRPYAALVDEDTVTVLLAGRHLPKPAAPWSADPEDPARWTAAREDLPAVVPDTGAGPAILVAVGDSGGRAAFLDLAPGPAITAVDGNPRTAPALLRALAAQLDARLPQGLVTVADGVHPDFAGPAVRDAFRAVCETPSRNGIVPVMVTAELPDPLPGEFSASPAGAAPRLRILALGPGRGHVRRLLADRYGQVLLTGTEVVADGNALGRAIARVLPHLPPVRPPQPGAATAAGMAPASELFDEEREGTTSVSGRAHDWSRRRAAVTAGGAPEARGTGEAEAGGAPRESSSPRESSDPGNVPSPGSVVTPATDHNRHRAAGSS